MGEFSISSIESLTSYQSDNESDNNDLNITNLDDVDMDINLDNNELDNVDFQEEVKKQEKNKENMFSFF